MGERCDLSLSLGDGKFRGQAGLLSVHRRMSGEPYFDEPQWDVDINTFMAVISLWLATIVLKQEKDTGKSGYLRLLGEAKDVWITTSAHRHQSGEQISKQNRWVGRWRRGVADSEPRQGGNNEGEGIVTPESGNEEREDDLASDEESCRQPQEEDNQEGRPQLTKEAIATKEAEDNPNVRVTHKNGIEVKELRTTNYALWIDRGVNSHQVEFPTGHKSLEHDNSGLHNYPVFGYTVSSYTKKKRESSESQPSPPPSSNANRNRRSPAQPRRQSTWRHVPKIERAVTSNAPLERLCAQELFANFLFALTAYCKRLHKASKARLEFEGSSGDELRWSNPMITKLAQAVESSGLATYEEAYMLVVPPFYARDLLPTSYGKKKKAAGASSYYYSGYTSSSSSPDRRRRRSIIIEERPVGHGPVL